jgi:hypothetical protein
VLVSLIANLLNKAKSKCLPFWWHQQNGKLLLRVSEAFVLKFIIGCYDNSTEGQVPQELAFCFFSSP